MPGFERAYSGRLLRLSIEEEEGPEGFALVAGLRTTSVSLNNEAVDATTVASEGFRELLPRAGLRALTVTGDGVVASGTSDRKLYLQAVEGTAAGYRLDFGNGDRFEGLFLITRFQRSGRHSGAEEFSMTLESTGPLYFTAGEMP